MSEMRLEIPSSAPSPSQPPPDDPEPSRGSLTLGVGLAWLILVGGEFLQVMGMSGFNMSRLNALWVPPLVFVVAVVALLKGSHPRTGQGMLLGLLSIMAVLLLLVAACFGLVSGGIH